MNMMQERERYLSNDTTDSVGPPLFRPNRSPYHGEQVQQAQQPKRMYSNKLALNGQNTPANGANFADSLRRQNSMNDQSEPCSTGAMCVMDALLPCLNDAHLQEHYIKIVLQLQERGISVAHPGI